MTLAAYQIQKKQVSFMGGSFHVKGLSLDDISILMRDYLADIDLLFKMYEKEEMRESAVAESAKFAIGIVRDAPALVGLLIALSAGEPDAVDIARQLPIPVQIDVVKAVIELTFEEAGGAKKFLDSVMNLVKKVRPAAASEA